MIRRYLARRNNPWELLVIAAMIFVPGLVMLLDKEPMFSTGQGFRARERGAVVSVLSPHGAHIAGTLAITASVVLVVFYLYARQAIARDPEPYVVEHGHNRDQDDTSI